MNAKSRQNDQRELMPRRVKTSLSVARWGKVSCIGIALLAIIIAAGDCIAVRSANAQTGLRQTATRTPTLRERLVLGLRARRPTEIAFLDAVVDSVERGDLPLKVVDQTFFWARRKSPRVAGQRVRRPIIYFEPALRAVAKRLNLRIRSNP